jgi:predicted PurR-regulated permease PerM
LIGVFLGPVLTLIIFEMLLAWLNSDENDVQAEAGPGS